VDARLTSLVKAIDSFVAAKKSQRVVGFVVLLADDTAASRQALADLAKANGIAMPLTLALEGAKGPAAYKIHPKASITVLASRAGIVRANFALGEPPPGDAAAQEKETARILKLSQKLMRVK